MKKPKWKAFLLLYIFNLVLIGLPAYFMLNLDALEIEGQFRFVGVILFILVIFTSQELKFDELTDRVKELESKSKSR
jgi:hypothetical protein